VDTAVVHFVPREPPAKPSFDLLSKTARAIFGTRRKQIHNNLRRVTFASMRTLHLLCASGTCHMNPR
jgi:16S rRNA A1518/A1519 N6-dimethyltransferase RsmA/KsgA/DIM1 with predicted DNA glycosylase/AP lyase activity